jgi:hypothetical protein
MNLNREKEKMYIFLDIDGVLVKEDAPGEEIDLDEDFMKYDEGCLNIFESVIRRYDNSQIVISSSWIEICTITTGSTGGNSAWEQT